MKNNVLLIVLLLNFIVSSAVTFGQKSISIQSEILKSGNYKAFPIGKIDGELILWLKNYTINKNMVEILNKDLSFKGKYQLESRSESNAELVHADVGVLGSNIALLSYDLKSKEMDIYITLYDPKNMSQKQKSIKIVTTKNKDEWWENYNTTQFQKKEYIKTFFSKDNSSFCILTFSNDYKNNSMIYDVSIFDAELHKISSVSYSLPLIRKPTNFDIMVNNLDQNIVFGENNLLYVYGEVVSDEDSKVKPKLKTGQYLFIFKPEEAEYSKYPLNTQNYKITNFALDMDNKENLTIVGLYSISSAYFPAGHFLIKYSAKQDEIETENYVLFSKEYYKQRNYFLSEKEIEKFSKERLMENFCVQHLSVLDNGQIYLVVERNIYSECDKPNNDGVSQCTPFQKNDYLVVFHIDIDGKLIFTKRINKLCFPGSASAIKNDKLILIYSDAIVNYSISDPKEYEKNKYASKANTLALEFDKTGNYQKTILYNTLGDLMSISDLNQNIIDNDLYFVTFNLTKHNVVKVPLVSE